MKNYQKQKTFCSWLTLRKCHILRLRRLVIPLLTKRLIIYWKMVNIYSNLLCNLKIWCLRNVQIFIDVSSIETVYELFDNPSYIVGPALTLLNVLQGPYITKCFDNCPIMFILVFNVLSSTTYLAWFNISWLEITIIRDGIGWYMYTAIDGSFHNLNDVARWEFPKAEGIL